ncbi:uncharacterized protein LOC144427149 isoform X2 [Styela clava]
MGENPTRVDVPEGMLEEYARTIGNDKWFGYCRNLGIPPSDIDRWKMSTLREEDKYQMIMEAFKNDPHGISRSVQDNFGSQNALVWDDSGQLDDNIVYRIIDLIPNDDWPRFARLVLGVKHARFSSCNLTEEQKVLMLKKWAFYRHPTVNIRERLVEAFHTLGPMMKGPTNVGTVISNAECAYP